MSKAPSISIKINNAIAFCYGVDKARERAQAFIGVNLGLKSLMLGIIARPKINFLAHAERVHPSEA